MKDSRVCWYEALLPARYQFPGYEKANIIDGVPERIYAARQLIGLFDTLTEVVTAAATP